jgi:predicted MFS family arabinose efflux permease
VYQRRHRREKAKALKTERSYELFLVILLFFTAGSVFLGLTSQYFLSPYLIKDLHLTSSQIGLLAAAVGLPLALSACLSGALSDRVGRRAVLIPSVLGAALTGGLSALAQNFLELLILRAAFGLIAGGCLGVASALMRESSPPEHSGRNVGIIAAGTSFAGSAVGPVLTTQIAERFGWRWSFFSAGVLCLIVGGLVWRFVREPQRIGANSESHAVPVGRYFSILRYRDVWICCVATTGVMAFAAVVPAFAPLYMVQTLHQSATTAGFLLGASGLGGFFMGMVGPAVSDHTGRKPAIAVMAAVFAVVPLILMAPACYRSLWLLSAALFACTTGPAISALTMFVIPAESVPPALSATAIGFTIMVSQILGGSVFPLLAGRLAQTRGPAAPLELVLGTIVLIFVAGLSLNSPVSVRIAATEKVATS